MPKPGLAPLAAILLRVQHELFNLGSILATLPEDVHPRQARVTEAEIERLESRNGRHERGSAPLRSFVLPGGGGSTPTCTSAGPCAAAPSAIVVALAREETVPRRSRALPEPPGRRPVCVEPLGQPRHRRAGNFVGTQPLGLRAG